MNPDPTPVSDLDEILTSLVEEWAEFMLKGESPDGIIAILKTKDKLTQWKDNEVVKALEEFRVFCYEEHAFEAFDTPDSNRQGWLDTKLRDFIAIDRSKKQ